MRYAAWIYVTLAILNLRDDVSNMLDGIGFNLGEMRLSLLLLLQAAIVLALLDRGRAPDHADDGGPDRAERRTSRPRCGCWR